MSVTNDADSKVKINPYLLFFILSLVLYLPSAFNRLPFPPDEFRNLYIASNIHSWHDFLFPQYVDGYYLEKPPFYFWFLTFFSRVTMLPPLILPTLFNALVAWVIVSFNYLFFKKEGHHEIGLLSSLLLLTTGIFFGMCIITRMEILFLLFIYLSIFFFWFAVKERKLLYFACATASMFFAVFTKGAFGLLFPLIAIVSLGIFTRKLATINKAFMVVGFAAALIVGWLVSFSKIDPGIDYANTLFFKQTVERAVDPRAHAEPWYYYLMLIFPIMLPWSFVAIGYFMHRNNPRYLWEKVFLAWFFGGLILLSLVKSKLPMYLILLTIPLCGLMGKFLWEGKDYLKRRLLMLSGVFFLLMWLGAYTYCKIANQFIPLSALFVLLVFMAMVFFMIKKPFRSRFKNFFIFWCLFLQLLNFIFIPFASNASDFGRLLSLLKEKKFSYATIYICERELFSLSLVHKTKPIEHLASPNNVCGKTSFMLISKESPDSCAPKKLTRIGKFSVFYRP